MADALTMAGHNQLAKKKERYMKWHRANVMKRVDVYFMRKAEEVAETLVETAIETKNPQALNSVLDRAFGKAAQLVNHGGQVDNPIVFMPATLLAKYNVPSEPAKERVQAEVIKDIPANEKQ